MATSNGEYDTSKTVENAFEILEFTKCEDGASLRTVVEEFGYSKSTAYRYLKTLEQSEYLVKEGVCYYPSLKFLDIGDYARKRNPGYSLLRTKVDELATITSERAQCLVEEHGLGVYLHRATGENAVQTDPGLGKKIGLHTTAAGKAILSYLPEKRTKAIIETHGLEPRTEATITDSAELFEELEQIREQQYAINREENVDGLHAVGVPVVGANGAVIGAISISGPSHRLKGEQLTSELPDLLLGVANEIELNIKHT